MLQLGGTDLSAENLAQYEDQITAWSGGLTQEADILLYGCEVAHSEDGQWLVDQIGEWSGADIAASDDLTGHSDLGGDWTFEYTVGAVETGSIFSMDVHQNWEGTLATTTVTTLDDVVSTDADLSSFCLLYTSPSPRDRTRSRMPSSA